MTICCLANASRAHLRYHGWLLLPQLLQAMLILGSFSIPDRRRSDAFSLFALPVLCTLMFENPIC